MAVWSALRRSRGNEIEYQTSRRTWWATLFRDAARSALALAAILLLADLALMPKWFLHIESDYHEKTLFLRQPEEGPKASRAAIAAVQGDQAAMARFRVEADGEVNGLLTGSRR